MQKYFRKLLLIIFFFAANLAISLIPTQSYAQVVDCGVGPSGQMCGTSCVAQGAGGACFATPSVPYISCGTSCCLQTDCPTPGGGGGGAVPTPTPTPIPTYPDLTVSNVGARTSTGSNPSPGYFTTGQSIAIRATINNIGDEWTCCYSQHAVFKDSDAYNADTPTMLFGTGANFPNGTSIDYMSWTGGSNYTTFNTQTFTQNEAGTYTLRVYADYGGNITETSGGNNVDSTTYDVYARLYGSVCWSKNEDTTCDAGEPGVDGVRISATRNGTSIGSHTTDSNGDYDFDYQAGGDYALTFSSNSWRTLNTNPRTTTLGPDTRLRFAAIPTYDLSGYIFIDDNRDGNKDSGETTGYANATVVLTGPAGEGLTTTTDATGRYSFPNRKRGDYTVTLTVPTDYKAYPADDNTRTITIPLNSTQNGWTADIGINRVYTIAGKIYVDADKSSSSMSSGDFNAAQDMPLANVVVHADPQGTQQSRSDRSDANGDFLITAIEPGDFLITADPGSDYVSLPTYPRPVTITAGDAHQRDIKFFGAYSVSGKVFIDPNDNYQIDTGESNYAASPAINVDPIPANSPIPIVTNNADGTYSVTGLINNQYRINYAGLPNGYVINNPQNGPPPFYNATVGISGTSCTVTPNAPSATCSTGSLQNLDFAIKAGQPWWQSYGLDVRMDSGVANPIPPTPDSACVGAYASLPGSTSTPGIIFSGATTPYFWQGGASANNWIVGTSTYPEQFPTNSLKTSYAYMQSVLSQSGIAATSLSGGSSPICSQLSNCTLPITLENGVYIASGDATLNSFTAPASRNYIFLINGNLTINGQIRVPTTSTATFFVSGNIIVAASVGSTAACPAPAAGSGDLEGFYSADRGFTINSSANCAAATPIPDKQLNIQGSVIVNASQLGGTFTNTRDLCASNIDFPTVTFRERPDMILNSPSLLHGANLNYREVAP